MSNFFFIKETLKKSYLDESIGIGNTDIQPAIEGDHLKMLPFFQPGWNKNV